MLGSGSVIDDRYHIVRELGRGGFGRTFEATSVATPDTAVALKLITLRELDDWKSFELFEREAEILRRLEHPGIPRYLDAFTTEIDGGPAFVLVQELAAGRNLADLVASGWRCGCDDARAIARELLDILAYLHTRDPPVLHRDIKPDNVLRAEHGAISLVDFGAVRAAYDRTSGSTIVGTYGYMAPEQLRGQASPATDLYGLAATLVFALHGRPPSELCHDGLRFELGELAGRDPALAWWLGVLLEPEPGRRFASAAEARAALESGRRRAPPKWLLAVGVAAAVLAGVGVAGFVLGTRTQEQPGEIAPDAPNVSHPSVQPRPPGFVWPTTVNYETLEAKGLPPPARGQPVVLADTDPVRVRWSAIVGNTSYRTNLGAVGAGDWRRVIVPSNGRSWGSVHDPEDGIYIIDQYTGAITEHIVPPGTGEKDCTGVAWSFHFAEDGTPVIDLVFGTDQDKVYRMMSTGDLIWELDIDGDAEAAPYFEDVDGDGSKEVVIGSEGGTLYSIDAETGAIEWTHKAGVGEWGATGYVSEPLVVFSRSRIYAAARDGSFRAFFGPDHQLAWAVEGESGMHSRPVFDAAWSGEATRVAFAEAYGTVYLADVATGELSWTWKSEQSALFGALGIYPDARCLTVPDRSGAMRCIELETGLERWVYQTEDEAAVTSGAVATDVDGRLGAELVFGTEGGQLVALDRDGRERWVVELGGPIETTPVTIGYDGAYGLVVNVNSGYLYALDFNTDR